MRFTHKQAGHHNEMYTTYFGLKEKPFSIAPNPEYLYMSNHHQEALAHLLYGVQEDGCLVLLTGDVGTGKTTICRCLLERLPVNTNVAIILNPKISSLDLLQTICEELGITCPKYDHSTKVYTDKLNKHLLNSHADGKTTVLIIDEAQGLDPVILEQLRLLTNLETNTNKLLKIILLGQPELEETLARPNLAQVNQRITSRYHLSPLKYDDVIAYVRHRLFIAGGGQNEFFTDKAFRVLFKKSKGVPRIINLICDRALLGAYAENSPTVRPNTVKKAAREILAPQKRKGISLRRVLFTSIILCALLIPVSYFIYPLLQEEKRITIQPLVEKESAATTTSEPPPTVPDPAAQTDATPQTKSNNTAALTQKKDGNSSFSAPEPQ